jgi:hypothetical protein
MNTIFALIALVGGVIGSLIAYKVVPLEKIVDYGEAEAWHDKYGKLVKILGPAAGFIGLLLLLWR